MYPKGLLIGGIIFLILILAVVFIKPLRHRVYALLVDAWAVVRPLRMIILLLGLSFFAFTKPDQAIDMFCAFGDDATIGHYSYFIFFLAGIVIWAATSWYSARVLLRLSDNSNGHDGELDQSRKNRRKRFIAWIPRMFGAVPYIIAFIALRNGGSKGLSWIAIGLMLLFFGLLLTRRKLMQLEPDEVRFSTARMHWHELPRRTRTIAYIALAFFFISLIIFLPPMGIYISQLIRPAAILAVSFATWTLGIVFLSYIDTRTPLPVFTVLLAIVVSFSFFNNNHYIRMIDEKEYAVKRPSLKEHYIQWVKAKEKEYAGSDSIPVYIIATQGGGIRAMHWTAGVLYQLDNNIPKFYSNTFAISGVSGGSVGAVFYNTWHRDQQLKRGAFLKTKFDTMISCDGLSPVTAGLVYSDMFQRFIPVPVEYFDRARMLEDAWSNAYEDATGLRTFDEPFTSLWAKGDYSLPCLLLNTAYSESGQKGIVSNVELDPEYFADVIDIIKITGKDLPAKTAALMSARFPYVTPAGTILDSEKVYGNFVDGGYVENTGLATAVQLLNMMTDVAYDPKINDPVFRKVRPIIIFIKNGIDAVKIPQPTAFMQEALSPPKAFISAWSRSGVGMEIGVKSLVYNLKLRSEFTRLVLDRDKGTLPLGWFLSTTAQNIMLDQENNLSTLEKNKYAYYVIEKWSKGVYPKAQQVEP